MNYLKLSLIFLLSSHMVLAIGTPKAKETKSSAPLPSLPKGAEAPEAGAAQAQRPLYPKLRNLALTLAAESNWKRCLSKFICPQIFNAGGEIGWARSSSANKQTQTYVCNINADSLFYLVSGKPANYSFPKTGVRKFSIHSKEPPLLFQLK